MVFLSGGLYGSNSFYNYCAFNIHGQQIRIQNAECAVRQGVATDFREGGEPNPIYPYVWSARWESEINTFAALNISAVW